MSTALREGLLHGALLAAGMTAIILISRWHEPRVWLGDYPPDVRAAAGPPGERAVALRRRWALLALALLVGVHVQMLARVAEAGAELSFRTVFVASYVCFSVFNLVDLLVIDLAILIGLRPGWAIVPDTDPTLPGYRDARFHARAWAWGQAGGVVLAGLAAAIAWSIAA